MKKIMIIWLLLLLSIGFTKASEYNGSIDSSNSISTNSLEVTLPCNPASVNNGSVNATTCAITCNANYTLSSNQCVSAWGGWGGGWAGWVIATTATTTGSITKTLSGEVETIHSSAGDITDSPYDDEMNQAYLFAFENGITTQPTIKKANMDWDLIRSHMAKIMANYATKVLGKSPNTWIMCEFNDIANETSEMKFYAKLACQLGIMWLESDWIPAKEFNPRWIVTRAEFGTALSRLLYNKTFNGWTPYYKNHLSALKKAGIIKDITDYNKEIRWYVMLMLMRAKK